MKRSTSEIIIQRTSRSEREDFFLPLGDAEFVQLLEEILPPRNARQDCQQGPCAGNVTAVGGHCGGPEVIQPLVRKKLTAFSFGPNPDASA
jgi:hypothetical protein